MNVYASVALSGDGYMDDRSPRRLILSTPADWREVMRLRAWADAILVGAETVRRDDPSLTVRDEALRRERLAANRPADPAKVTLSRSLRLAPASNFFTAGSGARIVFTDNAAASPLETAAEIVRIPDLSAARILTELEKRGFERLLVEGGPRTLGLFFAEGLVDTLRMAVNPAVRVGDPHAPRFEPPFDPARFPQQRRRLEGMEVTTYTLHPDRTEEDLHYLRQAIALSRRCTPCATSYRVGAVIVTRSGDRFTGYTHETSPTHHAETGGDPQSDGRRSRSARREYLLLDGAVLDAQQRTGELFGTDSAPRLLAHGFCSIRTVVLRMLRRSGAAAQGRRRGARLSAVGRRSTRDQRPPRSPRIEKKWTKRTKNVLFVLTKTHLKRIISIFATS